MEFQCLEHGSVDKFELRGYSVAHEPQVKAHEKDFEGITFIVECPEGGEITAENIKSESASRYLKKFSGWDEDIADAVMNYYEAGRGVEEFTCPHNHTGMSVTHIVDEVFIPGVPGNLNGAFIVSDGELHVFNLEEYGDLDAESFFEQVVAKAEDRNLEKINFESYRVDEFEQALNNIGFETEVTEQQMSGLYGGDNEKITAELDLN